MLRKMVFFSFLSSRMKSLTAFEASGSRLAVGSSMKSISGSWIKARAMASFCFIPFENAPTRTSLLSHSPSSFRKYSLLSFRWESVRL